MNWHRHSSNAQSVVALVATLHTVPNRAYDGYDVWAVPTTNVCPLADNRIAIRSVLVSARAIDWMLPADIHFGPWPAGVSFAIVQHAARI